MGYRRIDTASEHTGPARRRRTRGAPPGTGPLDGSRGPGRRRGRPPRRDDVYGRPAASGGPPPRRRPAHARYRPRRDRPRRYGRPYGYARAYRYGREYATPDDDYAPYGRDFFRWGAPVPGRGIYPDQHWGGGMIYGLEGGGWAPFGLIGFPAYAYEYEYRRRRRPDESPTYGRGADRALRAWAGRHGYALGPAIRPTGRERPSRRRRRRRGRRWPPRRWFRRRRR